MKSRITRQLIHSKYSLNAPELVGLAFNFEKGEQQEIKNEVVQHRRNVLDFTYTVGIYSPGKAFVV